jgi:hypothetical protein
LRGPTTFSYKHHGPPCWAAPALAFAATVAGVSPSSAQEKPNIVVIMGDDIGMWNIGAYHRGLMAGRTPNLDKIAEEACCL